MSDALLDLYGCLLDLQLKFLQTPNEIILEFKLDGQRHEIRFLNPITREPFLTVLDDCWGIRICDINQKSQQWVEFGRYRVEFWDEDNPISHAFVNSFEHRIA